MGPSIEPWNGRLRVSAAPQAPSQTWVWMAVLLLTAVVYLPTLRFQFVYDDHGQILDNRYALAWSWLPRYFTSHVWGSKPLAAAVYYRPLFLVWLLLNYQLFGVNPFWWHLTSVLMHVLATFLVYRLAVRLLKDPWPASFAALLFGLHPVHIESVAWISGVSDPLLAVLWLPSMLSYLRSRDPAEPHSGRCWWLSLVFAGAALLAKETASVLPVLIFGHAALFPSDKTVGSWRGRVLEGLRASAPYLVLDGVYLCARFAVIGTVASTINPLAVTTMIATWPLMFQFYLNQLLLPWTISMFYPVSYVTTLDLRYFWFPLAGLCAAAAALIGWSLRSRVAAFGSFLLVMPILPVIYLRAYAVGEIVHDRYLYLPSIGFCLLAAMALRNLPRREAAAVGIALPLALGVITIRESRYWRDDMALFTHSYQRAPNNYLAQQNLGVSLLMQGQFADALPLLQKIAARGEYNDTGFYVLGRCYFGLKRYQEAAACFKKSIASNPREPNPLFYLGLVEMDDGELAAAESDIRHALMIRPMPSPEYRLYHLYLAEILERKGDLAGALSEYERELEENPNSPTAQERRATLRAARGGP